jgi:hypothetical protein
MTDKLPSLKKGCCADLVATVTPNTGQFKVFIVSHAIVEGGVPPATEIVTVPLCAPGHVTSPIDADVMVGDENTVTIVRIFEVVFNEVTQLRDEVITQLF